MCACTDVKSPQTHRPSLFYVHTRIPSCLPRPLQWRDLFKSCQSVVVTMEVTGAPKQRRLRVSHKAKGRRTGKNNKEEDRSRQREICREATSTLAKARRLTGRASEMPRRWRRTEWMWWTNETETCCDKEAGRQSWRRGGNKKPQRERVQLYQASFDTVEIPHQYTHNQHVNICSPYVQDMLFMSFTAHLRGWRPGRVVVVGWGGKKARGSVGQWVMRWGVKGCKGGRGNGPVATGSDGSVGLGQSARLKGTWVGPLWDCWERGGTEVRPEGWGWRRTLEDFLKPSEHQSSPPV